MGSRPPWTRSRSPPRRPNPVHSRTAAGPARGTQHPACRAACLGGEMSFGYGQRGYPPVRGRESGIAGIAFTVREWFGVRPARSGAFGDFSGPSGRDNYARPVAVHSRRAASAAKSDRDLAILRRLSMSRRWSIVVGPVLFAAGAIGVAVWLWVKRRQLALAAELMRYRSRHLRQLMRYRSRHLRQLMRYRSRHLRQLMRYRNGHLRRNRPET